MTGFSTTWFLDGVLHPLQTPSHIILLVGLGLLLGQQTKTTRHFVIHIALFMALLCCGLITNHFLSMDIQNELILLLAALISGLLLILKMDVPILILVTLLMSCGFMLGYDTRPVIIPGIRNVSIYSWLSGATVSMFSLLVILTLGSMLLHRFLHGMILRVAGSWIATSAIFVLTLLLAKL